MRFSPFFRDLAQRLRSFPPLAEPPIPFSSRPTNLREVVPGEAYKLIEQQLVALTSKSSTGLSVAGIVSLLIALYSARLAASSMMQALNVIYKVEETRGFITTNVTAILFTVMAIVVFLLAIARCLWSCPHCSVSSGSRSSSKILFAISAGPCWRPLLS